MKLKKNKKGDLSIQTIVIAALSLVILIILIMVFRTQISNAVKGYFNIGAQAQDMVGDEDNCASLFDDRFCAKECTAEAGEYEVYIVPGKFADCEKKGADYNCCERSKSQP